MATDSRYWSTGPREVSRRRFLGTTLTAAAGLGAAALVGCSSAGRPAAAPQPKAATSGAPKGPTIASITGDTWGNREPDGVPKYGGTLNWAASAPPLANLDTTLSASGMVHNVASQAYSMLTHISRDPKDRNSPHVFYPELATSWETSDPLKMTFKLRQGVKWHNVAPLNGRPLTAEDVKYAITRAQTEKTSLHKGTLGAIKSIETPDAGTVIVNSSKFDPLLFTSLANQPGWIVPREVVEAGKIRELIVGTGPFIFQKWDQDSRISYKKNPDYFIKGAPFFDELNILQIFNEETRTASYQSGQVPIYDIPAPNVKTFQNDAKYIVEPYLRVVPQVLFMNYTDARWKDERVRRALALALDTDVFVKTLADGNGLWRGIVSNQHGGWTLTQQELKSKKYYLRQDIQEAKQLIAAAGYPDGIQSGLLFNTSYPQGYQDSVQYVAEQLTKNKIVNTKPYGQDQATMRKNQDEHKYDGLVFGLDGQGAPEAFLLDYRTGGVKNGSGLADKDVDADVNKVLATVDVKERQAATKAFIDKYLQKVMYKIELVDATFYESWTRDVHNYVAAPPFQYGGGFHYTWIGNA